MPITPPTDGYTPNPYVGLNVAVLQPDPGGGFMIAGEYNFSFDSSAPELIDGVVLAVVRWLQSRWPEATHYQVTQQFSGSQVVVPEPEEIPA